MAAAHKCSHTTKTEIIKTMYVQCADDKRRKMMHHCGVSLSSIRNCTKKEKKNEKKNEGKMEWQKKETSKSKTGGRTKKINKIKRVIEMGDCFNKRFKCNYVSNC